MERRQSFEFFSERDVQDTANEAYARIEAFGYITSDEDSEAHIDLIPDRFKAPLKTVTNYEIAFEAGEEVLTAVYNRLASYHPVAEKAFVEEEFPSFNISREFRMFWNKEGKARVGVATRLYPHHDATSLQKEVPIDLIVMNRIPYEYLNLLQKRQGHPEYPVSASIAKSLLSSETLDRQPYQPSRLQKVLGSLGLK